MCIRDYTIVNLTSGKVFSEVVVGVFVVAVVVDGVVLVLLCIDKSIQQRWNNSRILQWKTNIEQDGNKG